MKSQPDYSVRAVERVVRVLSVLSEADEPLSLSAVAAQTGLTVWTALRLLRTLQQQGMVLAHPPDNRYTLGFRLLEFAQALQRQLDIVRITRPFLTALRGEVNETISLVVRSGDFGIVVALVDSSQPLRRVKVVGEPTPLYVGASGKVLLAGADSEEVEDYLGRTLLVPLSPNTPTNPHLVREQVAETRELGYAISINERGAGGVGVAAPVRGHDGSVVAALDLGAPLSRFTPETRELWVTAVVSTARQISRALGYVEAAARGAGRGGLARPPAASSQPTEPGEPAETDASSA